MSEIRMASNTDFMPVDAHYICPTGCPCPSSAHSEHSWLIQWGRRAHNLLPYVATDWTINPASDRLWTHNRQASHVTFPREIPSNAPNLHRSLGSHCSCAWRVCSGVCASSLASFFSWCWWTWAEGDHKTPIVSVYTERLERSALDDLILDLLFFCALQSDDLWRHQAWRGVKRFFSLLLHPSFHLPPHHLPLFPVSSSAITNPRSLSHTYTHLQVLLMLMHFVNAGICSTLCCIFPHFSHPLLFYILSFCCDYPLCCVVSLYFPLDYRDI